jgi:tetratricopeptide (TPR) repeat protein
VLRIGRIDARIAWTVFILVALAACGPSRAERLETLLAEGAAHLEADELDEAYAAFSAAAELESGSARALSGMTRTLELLASRDAYERGLAALEREDFLEARNAFAEVRPDDTVRYAAAQEAYRTAEDTFVTTALDLAEGFLDEGDIQSALDVMARLALLVPDHPELRERGPAIADRAAEVLMETATYQFLEGRVSEARELLTRGIDVLRASSLYDAARERLAEILADSLVSGDLDAS